MGTFLATRCCQCMTGTSKISKDTFFGSSAPVPEKGKSQILNQESETEKQKKKQKWKDHQNNKITAWKHQEGQGNDWSTVNSTN